MFSDPFSVTYDGNALSLPRTGTAKDYCRYNTADQGYELVIANNLANLRNGPAHVSIKLSRRMPDPTPGDVFNAYRDIRNSFGFSLSFDSLTRAGASDDLPKLRAALDALVIPGLLTRLISGEK